jgi:hypothetical protein
VAVNTDYLAGRISQKTRFFSHCQADGGLYTGRSVNKNNEGVPMSVFTRILTGSALVLSSFAAFAQPGAWHLEKDDAKKDIQVFTREIPGSELKEFRGVTHIKAPVSAFVALLKDPEQATSWMHNVKKFDVMETRSDLENIVYTVNDTPWPVTNRDVYIRSVFSQDPSTFAVTVTLTGLADYKPKNDNFIRMPALTGAWTFTPQQNGIVEVSYQVHANPGGSLPNWLVNAIVVDTPYNTLNNLQKKVDNVKYLQASYSYIKEPVAAQVAEQQAQ